MSLCVTLALSACGSGDPTTPSGSSSAKYALTGTVSGLTGTGLVLSVNGTPVTVGGGATSVALAAGLASGTAYTVTVVTQPAGQTCSVAAGSGTITSANVANVVVTCSSQAFELGGTISGLTGSGLVLTNGSDTLDVNADATSFTFPAPVAQGSSYTVTVSAQPAGLACSVSHGTGTMPAAAVTSVAVSCTDQPFTVGGTISWAGQQCWPGVDKRLGRPECLCQRDHLYDAGTGVLRQQLRRAGTGRSPGAELQCGRR